MTIVSAQIVGMLVLAGIVLFAVEGHINDEVFPEPSNIESVVRSIFNHVQSYVGMGDFRHVPLTHGGRFVTITTSIAILIILTTYTALITSAMVAKAEVGGTFKNLKEARKKAVE